jgi:hypothetical protein
MSRHVEALEASLGCELLPESQASRNLKPSGLPLLLPPQLPPEHIKGTGNTVKQLRNSATAQRSET